MTGIAESEDDSLVWVPDPQAVWIPGKVTRSSANEVVVAVDGCGNDAYRGREERVFTLPTVGGTATSQTSLKRPLHRNKALLGDGALHVDDLTDLPELHEAAVLHALDVRFAHGLIYTISGPVLLAVNPFRTLPGLYSLETLRGFAGSDQLRPHVFSLANQAYKGIWHHRTSQSVLVSGESGAGKTETTKLIAQFLANVGTGVAELSVQRKPLSRVERSVLGSNPLLEAFGNAKTPRNENSSRFGKYIEFQFGHEAPDSKGLKGAPPRLVGARMHTYLLEKVRVIQQQAGERNFHIFYQMLAAANVTGSVAHIAEAERPMSPQSLVEDDEWAVGNLLGSSFFGQAGLDGLAGYSITSFAYLRGSAQVQMEHKRDAEDFGVTLSAMRAVGFSPCDVSDVLRALAAVLHLGDIVIATHRHNSEASDVFDIEPGRPFAVACGLLGLDGSVLRDGLCTRTMEAPMGEQIQISNTVRAATEGRDALARHLYHAVFNHIVERANRSMGFLGQATFCGVLDIFGFEFFETNSFEQLCINFANEVLQHYFNEFIFERETALYREEGIPWETQDFPDNGEVVNLLALCPTGILHMLDEECFVVGSSSSLWRQKLVQAHAGHVRLSIPRQQSMTFTIQHFAGPVTYSADGVLKKNQDRLSLDHMRCLGRSSWPWMQGCFTEAGRTFGAEVRHPSNGAGSVPKVVRAQRYTVASEYRQQLQGMMAQIRTTSPHFVRCIKPNPLNQPFSSEPARLGGLPRPLFDRRSVVEQLRYQGVLEAIRVARAGYPARYLHAEFFAEFRFLADPASRAQLEAEVRRAGSVDGEVVSQLLALPSLQTLLRRAPPVSGLGWAAGRTRLFLKQGHFAVLWWARAQRRLVATARLQAAARGRLARRAARRRSCALATIQRYARGAAARAEVRRLRRARDAAQLEASLRQASQEAEDHEQSFIGHVSMASGDVYGQAERADEHAELLQANSGKVGAESAAVRDTPSDIVTELRDEVRALAAAMEVLKADAPRLAEEQHKSDGEHDGLRNQAEEKHERRIAFSRSSRESYHHAEYVELRDQLCTIVAAVEDLKVETARRAEDRQRRDAELDCMRVQAAEKHEQARGDAYRHAEHAAHEATLARQEQHNKAVAALSEIRSELEKHSHAVGQAFQATEQVRVFGSEQGKAVLGAVTAAVEGLKADNARRAEEQQRRDAELDRLRVQAADKHDQVIIDRLSQTRGDAYRHTEQAVHEATLARQEQHNKTVAAIFEVRSELEKQSDALQQALHAMEQVQAIGSEQGKAMEILGAVAASLEDLKAETAHRTEEQRRREVELDHLHAQAVEKHDQVVIDHLSQSRQDAYRHAEHAAHEATLARQEQHKRTVALILEIRSEVEKHSDAVRQALQATEQVQAIGSEQGKAAEILGTVAAAMEDLKAETARRVEEQQRRDAQFDRLCVQAEEKHEQMIIDRLSQVKDAAYRQAEHDLARREQHKQTVAAIAEIRSELEKHSDVLGPDQGKAMEMLNVLKDSFEQHVLQVEADRLKSAALDVTPFGPLGAVQAAQQAIGIIQDGIKEIQHEEATSVAGAESQGRPDKGQFPVLQMPQRVNEPARLDGLLSGSTGLGSSSTAKSPTPFLLAPSRTDTATPAHLRLGKESDLRDHLRQATVIRTAPVAAAAVGAAFAPRCYYPFPTARLETRRGDPAGAPPPLLRTVCHSASTKQRSTSYPQMPMSTQPCSEPRPVLSARSILPWRRVQALACEKTMPTQAAQDDLDGTPTDDVRAGSLSDDLFTVVKMNSKEQISRDEFKSAIAEGLISVTRPSLLCGRSVKTSGGGPCIDRRRSTVSRVVSSEPRRGVSPTRRVEISGLLRESGRGRSPLPKVECHAMLSSGPGTSTHSVPSPPSLSVPSGMDTAPPANVQQAKAPELRRTFPVTAAAVGTLPMPVNYCPLPKATLEMRAGGRAGAVPPSPPSVFRHTPVSGSPRPSPSAQYRPPLPGVASPVMSVRQLA